MRPKKIKPLEGGKGKKIAPPGALLSKPSENQKPIFSLCFLRRDFCLSDCQKDEKAAFADTLHQLSQFTWTEIYSQSRHKNGCEKIERTSIKASIPDHLTPDVNFLAFRFCGKAPMVGYREGNTFHILWIDRAFTLYRHSN